MGFSEVWREKISAAIQASEGDIEASPSARKLLQLTARSSTCSPPSVEELADAAINFPALDAWLSFLLRIVGSPPFELESLRRRTCTRELCPGAVKLQLNLFGLCAECFLKLRASRAQCAEADGQAGVYVPFMCAGRPAPHVIGAGDMDE